MKKLTIALACFAFTSFATAQELSNYIHVDQFGYPIESAKVAVLSNPQVGYNSNESYTPAASIELRNAQTNNAVFSSAPVQWNGGATHEDSGDSGWWFDFSSVITPGEYYVYDPNSNERSSLFYISDACYTEILKTAGRAFFYNRCNDAKEEPFAQGWSDTDNFNNPLQDANCRYIYDPGNASLEKDLSGGWFDAGDYNKYVTFAHAAVHNLLWAFEENPQAFGDDWNIPESGNGIPDILDEVKWELEWLAKMTNPDGSTHIKMGSQNYSDNTSSPPSLNDDQRFYGPTCSSASISLASMFAHAVKVFRDFPEFQSFADDMEAKAIAAYAYSKTFVDTNSLETDCDDGSIVAGDADWNEERQLAHFFTAAVHLFDITGDPAYNDYVINNVNTLEQIETTFWSPYYTEVNDALIHYTLVTGTDPSTVNTIITSWLDMVGNDWNNFFGFSEDDLYRAQMPEWSYHWGSNQVKANYGVINNLARKSGFFPSDNDSFNAYIDEVIHYFHGVNPQGMVYLSNMYPFGAERSANEVYHTWFADGTDYDNAITSLYGPAPGFVSGGPNSNFSVSTLVPPFGQPRQKSYLDFNDGFPNNSWEITEPAIYYQAAYIRLLANRVNSGTVLSNNTATTGAVFLLYPNPASETIHLPDASVGAKVAIYNALGSLVKTSRIEEARQIDITGLAAGMYFVELSSEQQFARQKLIIR